MTDSSDRSGSIPTIGIERDSHGRHDREASEARPMPLGQDRPNHDVAAGGTSCRGGRSTEIFPIEFQGLILAPPPPRTPQRLGWNLALPKQTTPVGTSNRVEAPLGKVGCRRFPGPLHHTGGTCVPKSLVRLGHVPLVSWLQRRSPPRSSSPSTPSRCAVPPADGLGDRAGAASSDIPSIPSCRSLPCLGCGLAK